MQKYWTQSDHMWKSYKQQSADFSIKKLFFLKFQIIKKCAFSASNRSKNRQKHVLRTILLLENSMRTKLKLKKIMDFSIFRRPGTVEIACFQKNPRERCHLAFECTYSVRQWYFTSSVKIWAESDHMWKSYKQRSDDFFVKNAHLRNS